MVDKEILEILKALSDETRLKIVEFLLDGEKCVCEIFPHVKRTQSTVSIQLSVLARRSHKPMGEPSREAQ